MQALRAFIWISRWFLTTGGLGCLGLAWGLPS